MIDALGIANYRSFKALTVRMGSLNVVTGPNGSGKSSLYRTLRLLANCAQGNVISALAREGGLQSTLWAGPESTTGAQRRGAMPVAGTMRQAQLGTRTPVLGATGWDLAAALRTIIDMGERADLDAAVEDAFPGCRVDVTVDDVIRFGALYDQEGLLRPLSAAELSDGTLRYLFWIAALLTPRPPPMMVLNEPETSLHPDLLPALGRLIIRAVRHSQPWVISHAGRLLNVLERDEAGESIYREKVLGATEVFGRGLLDRPNWYWPD